MSWVVVSVKRFIIGVVIGFLLGGGTFTAVSLAGAAQRLGFMQQWFNSTVAPVVQQWSEVMESSQGRDAVESTGKLVDGTYQMVTQGPAGASEGK